MPPATSLPFVLGGQYIVQRELGAGGMGTIFFGLHQMTEQPVAIKMLHQQHSKDPQIRERFLSEARVLARLEHPNIVQWKHSLEEDGHLYLIMQFVEGENAEQRMRRQKRLPLEEAIPITLQSLMGLQYAHERGIIHRDLKPANLLIGKDGVVKLADFGIAKIVGSQSQTQVGMAIGTFLYMSPEQILAKPLDGRSDIYSMGITLFEMLTGTAPFQGSTHYDVCKLHLEKPLPSVRQWDATLPADIDLILAKATQKNPEQRYQTAIEFLDDLIRAFPHHLTRITQISQLLPSLQTVIQGNQQNQATAKKSNLFLYLFILFGMLGGIFFFFLQDDLSSIQPDNTPSWQGLPFTEDFKSNKAGWPLGEHFNSMLSFTKEGYLIRTKDGKNNSTFCPGYLTLASSPLEISLTSRVLPLKAAAPPIHGFAFAFKLLQKKSQGIYVALDPLHHRIAIARVFQGQKTFLLPWKKIPEIPSKDFHTLITTIKDGKISVTFQDKQIALASLPPDTQEGQICLFANQSGSSILVKKFRAGPPSAGSLPR